MASYDQNARAERLRVFRPAVNTKPSIQTKHTPKREPVTAPALRGKDG